MTRMIFLPLFLCLPLLSHAQTNANKEASLVAPSASLYGRPENAINSPGTPASTNAATSHATSQGVVPPKLIYSIPMKDDGNQHYHIEARQKVILVELTVNESGQPIDLHIPDPVDAPLDVEVLATVGKFRYVAGTLNGKPCQMPVRLHYVVPVGAIY